MLTTLLGAATTIQPPSRGRGRAGGQHGRTAVAAVETAGQLPARTVKMGCLGPDELCDLGGDAVDCAEDPIDCGKDAAGGVKDGDRSTCSTARPDRLRQDGCPAGPRRDLRRGLPGIGLPGVPGLPGIPGLPNVGDLFGAGIPGLGDIPNPFDELGDVIAKAAADAWTAAMLAIWSSGLFVLRIVLTFSRVVPDPDLRADGPGKDVYAFTLWLALRPGGDLGDDPARRRGLQTRGQGPGAGAHRRRPVRRGVRLLVRLLRHDRGRLRRAHQGADEGAAQGVNTWPDWDPLGGLGIDDITDGTRGHRARPSWASSCGSPRSDTCWSTSPGRPRCWCWPPPARSPRPGWSPTPAAPGSGRACAGSTPPRSPRC